MPKAKGQVPREPHPAKKAAADTAATKPNPKRKTRKPKKAPARKRGRPTEYGPHTLAITRNYIDNYWRRTGRKADPFPSIVGLARLLGVRRETVHEWARQEDKADFSNMLGELSDEQERALLAGGANRSIHSVIARLVLTKHGYHTVERKEHAGTPGGAPIPVAAAVVTADMDPIEASRIYRASLNPDTRGA